MEFQVTNLKELILIIKTKGLKMEKDPFVQVEPSSELLEIAESRLPESSAVSSFRFNRNI